MTYDAYTEDTLVQQTTADYLEKQLGWESVYAYSNEGFGPDCLPGHGSDRGAVFTRYPRAKLVELNPSLSQITFATGHRCILPYLMSGEIVV